MQALSFLLVGLLMDFSSYVFLGSLELKDKIWVLNNGNRKRRAHQL